MSNETAALAQIADAIGQQLDDNERQLGHLLQRYRDPRRRHPDDPARPGGEINCKIFESSQQQRLSIAGGQKRQPC